MPIATEQSQKASTRRLADSCPKKMPDVTSAEGEAFDNFGHRLVAEMIENLKRNIPENRRLIEAQMEKNRQARAKRIAGESGDAGGVVAFEAVG